MEVLLVVSAVVNVNSVPPLVRHSTLEKKIIRGPEYDTFSPGTEYHFARNSFFPGESNFVWIS
jgi:hypothetical protein